MMHVLDKKHALMLWLGILLGGGFALASWASYHTSAVSIRYSIIRNELPLTTDNVYSEIQKDLIRPILTSRTMAHDTFLHDWANEGEKNPEKITRYLKEIQRKNDAFTSFFVSERSRIYYQSEGILKHLSENSEQDKWYFRVRKLSALYEINFDPDEANQNALTIFINYRVIDLEGKFLGAAGLGLKADSVRKIIDRYQERFQRNIYFSDTHGNVTLFSTALNLTGQNIASMEGISQHARHIQRHASETYRYDRGGKTYLLYTRFIPELNWHLFVEKDEDAALSSIRHTLLINLAICIFVTAAVLLLTHWSVEHYRSRLRQEAEAANRTKSQILAYISHDLKAPATTIIQYTNMLDADSDGDTLAEYKAGIRRNALHQIELIADLVEYAQGNLAQLELHPSPTYIYSFLDGVAHEAKRLASVHDNRFEMRVSDSLPAVVMLDRKRLRQVLLNLLSNAAKFTTAGDIFLDVQSTSDMSDSGQILLCFSVVDTGIGISGEDMQRIFQPFEHGRLGKTGAGLGLAIANQIVNKMGGVLHVHSTVAQGSRFWFEIATSAAKESDILQPILIGPTMIPWGKDKCVLVVDDDQDCLDYLFEVLVMIGFDAVCAHDAKEALQIIAQRAVELIVTDQFMINDNGWDVLRAVHERFPTHTPPVVLYSAPPPRRPQNFPPDLDFDAVLLKGVFPEELELTLQKLLHSNLNLPLPPTTHPADG